MTMILSLSSWLRREVYSGQRSRKPRLTRQTVCKPWLEALENRTVLSSWSTVAPMPTARDALAAASGVDGRIYAIGGEDDNVNLHSTSTVESYNPATNSWSTVAPMPTARELLAAAAGADGRIYAIAGE